MIEASRFSRTARGERRANSVVDPRKTERHLLDERGVDLGTISEGTVPLDLGPLEPTVYLRREMPSPRADRDEHDDWGPSPDGPPDEEVEQ